MHPLGRPSGPSEHPQQMFPTLRPLMVRLSLGFCQVYSIEHCRLDHDCYHHYLLPEAHRQIDTFAKAEHKNTATELDRKTA